MLHAPRLLLVPLLSPLVLAGCSGNGSPSSPAIDAASVTTDDAGGVAPSGDDAGAPTDTPGDAAMAAAEASTPEFDASAFDAGATPRDAGAVPSGNDAGPAPFGRVVGGYYPNWTPSPVRIRDVDPHYNVIYLFAATPVGGSPGTTGAIEWTAPGDGLGAATNLNADLAYARWTQGRKIILSVGGAGNSISFPERSKSQAFVDSVESLYAQMGGFDGIDWDTYEGSDSPDTSEMIWSSLQLKSHHPGFLITTPPAPWSTVDQTFCSQMVQAGALDWAAPQYYDGPNLATQAYVVPSVDTWAGLLGDGKVVVGFGVADATNYMTIAEAVSTWDAVAARHPALGGAFDWQIDVDQSTGWPFATQVGPLVNP